VGNSSPVSAVAPVKTAIASNSPSTPKSPRVQALLQGEAKPAPPAAAVVPAADEKVFVCCYNVLFEMKLLCGEIQQIVYILNVSLCEGDFGDAGAVSWNEPRKDCACDNAGCRRSRKGNGSVAVAVHRLSAGQEPKGGVAGQSAQRCD
jgi:hypothetical protein